MYWKTNLLSGAISSLVSSSLIILLLSFIIVLLLLWRWGHLKFVVASMFACGIEKVIYQAIITNGKLTYG